MSVVIRLKRIGSKKRPCYRLVAADSRRQRDGRFLEILGHYNPISDPFELVVHKDRVDAWLKNGAAPSDQAASLLRSAGISLQIAATRSSKKKATGDKAPVKRAVKRTPSARKVKRKAAKKAAKKAAPKAAPATADA